MSDDAQRREPHLSPMVIWGNLVATIGLGLMLSTFLFNIYTSNEQDKSDLEHRVTAIEVKQDASDTRYGELREMLRDMNGKLDKLMGWVMEQTINGHALKDKKGGGN